MAANDLGLLMSRSPLKLSIEIKFNCYLLINNKFYDWFVLADNQIQVKDSENLGVYDIL